MVKCFIESCYKRGYLKDRSGVLLCYECYTIKNMKIDFKFNNENLGNISKDELYKISTTKVKINIKEP